MVEVSPIRVVKVDVDVEGDEELLSQWRKLIASF